LANVNDPAGFGQHICSIILDAHLKDARFRGLSATEIRTILKKVEANARQLRALLERIDVGSKGSQGAAGSLLEIKLGHSPFKGDLLLIPDWIRLLSLMSDAASSANRDITPKRGPKGAGGNFAFDSFIWDLEMAARQRSVTWTNNRKADGTWGGSLL